jgi:hypothetical protein
MADPRVELTGLAGGPAAADVLDRLDRVELVLELGDGRAASREDAAGLFNLVNVAARIFPHWEIRIAPGIACDLPPFASGDLAQTLAGAAVRVGPAPTRGPDRRLGLGWGADPSIPGLALDASGWSCSLGPSHLTLDHHAGPAVGALAAGNWAVGQLLHLALAELGVPGHETEGFRWNLLDYRLQGARGPAGTGTVSLPALVCAGCGSVGSSTIYAALLAGAHGGPLELVDPDRFGPRNTLRYPILTGPAPEARKA